MAKRKRITLGRVENSSIVYKLILRIAKEEGLETPLDVVKLSLCNEAKRRNISISSNGRPFME